MDSQERNQAAETAAEKISKEAAETAIRRETTEKTLDKVDDFVSGFDREDSMTDPKENRLEADDLEAGSPEADNSTETDSLKGAGNAITEGSIWKQLLLFFFPILIGSFFQQLYNTVDTVVVGRYVGKEALAAVGTTGILINLLIGFFIGIASGASVIISQYFGGRDHKNLSKAVHTAFGLGIIGGLIITVLGLALAKPALRLINVPEEVLPQSLTYMRIIFAGVSGGVVYNIGTGIFRAIGNSRYPLYVLIICCLINIVLDLLFVVAFHWDVMGVALATVLAQLCSSVLVMRKLTASKESYRLEVKKIRIHRDILRNIMRIGLPAGFQSVLYSVSNLVVQRSINGFGTNTLAAWSAISRVDGFVWMVMGAFGISVSTFVGQNFGAGNYDRVLKGTRTCLLLTGGATLLLSVIEFIFAAPILRIFTGDEAVVALGTEFARIWAPAYLLYVFIEIYAAAIRGTGESVYPTLITLIGVCGLRFFWVGFVVPRWNVPQALAACYPVTWGITAVIFIIYYLRKNWLKRGIGRKAAA